MTTARTLIKDAYREAGIVGISADPSDAELTEGLRRLNALLNSLFGNELGEQLATVDYGTNGLTNAYAKTEDESSNISSVYVPANIRLILNLSSAASLYLHPNPEDGARLAIVDNSGNLSSKNAILLGNGRQIEGSSSITLNTNSLNREWFYRADLGNWLRVNDLGADDISPFPEAFDDLLTTLLAFRVNPRFGAQTSQEMTNVLTRARRAFRARYRQTVEKSVEDAIVWLPSNPWNRYTSVDPSVSFYRGR